MFRRTSETGEYVLGGVPRELRGRPAVAAQPAGDGLPADIWWPGRQILNAKLS